MLTTGGGDCYGFACTFAAMARELGYNPYVVLGRVSGTRDGAADGLTRHGWVMIDGVNGFAEIYCMPVYPRYRCLSEERTKEWEK